jgi:predicted TIM-barrel fold metal-dependent hydrolase
MIIDMHVHAFPDALAARAVPALEKEGGVKAFLDGRVSSLVRSMLEAGIDRALVCSIATKPAQFSSILAWSRSMASDRIVPLASIHPDDPLLVDRVREVREAGLVGIKLHPYYQNFDLDESRLFPLWEALEASGLLVVSHTGFDIAFPRIRRAEPARVRRVLDAFPRLRFVATHFGGWEDWDAVERELLGRPITLELSYSLEDLGPARARRMALAHPPGYLLFGTDSPWKGQRETLTLLRALDLPAPLEAAILGGNAAALLGYP